jgi:ribosome-binding protein aMBF1 (putative translation factor)
VQHNRTQQKYIKSISSPKNSINLRKPSKIKRHQSRNERNTPRVEELELLDDYRKIMKKKRQQLNMTLSEFANAVGITEASYKSIEAGKTDLLIKDALKVEKKFKLKLAEYAGFNKGDDSQEESKKPAGELTLGDMYLKKKKG